MAYAVCVVPLCVYPNYCAKPHPFSHHHVSTLRRTPRRSELITFSFAAGEKYECLLIWETKRMNRVHAFGSIDGWRWRRLAHSHGDINDICKINLMSNASFGECLVFDFFAELFVRVIFGFFTATGHRRLLIVKPNNSLLNALHFLK